MNSLGTFKLLSNLNVTAPDGTVCFVTGNTDINDGFQGKYRFSSTATDNPDGLNVIQIGTSNGRWLLEYSYGTDKTNSSNAITAIQTSLATTNTNIAGLATGLNTTNTNVTNLTTSLATTNTNLANYETSNDLALNNLTNTVTTYNTANDSNISNINSSISTLQIQNQGLLTQDNLTIALSYLSPYDFLVQQIPPQYDYRGEPSSSIIVQGDTLETVAENTQAQIDYVIRQMASDNRAKAFNKILTNAAFTILCQGTSLVYGQQDPSGTGGTLNGATQKRALTPWPETMALMLTTAGYSPTLINQGYPGDRTTDGINRWYNTGTPGAITVHFTTTAPNLAVQDIIIPKNNGDFVFLDYLYNDANNYGGKASGPLSIPDYTTNLKAMVLAHLVTGAHVVLVNDYNVYAISGGVTSDRARINNYRAALLDVAAQWGLDVVDAQQILEPLTPNWQSDSIHWNPVLYCHLGCQMAGYVIAPYAKKFRAGDWFSYANQPFPFTSTTAGQSQASLNGTLMNVSVAPSGSVPKVYAVVLDVMDWGELVFTGFINTGSTVLVVSANNNGAYTFGGGGNITPFYQDISITFNAATNHKKRTGLFLNPGRWTILFKNTSTTTSVFLDAIGLERPAYDIKTNGPFLDIGDADHTVTEVEWRKSRNFSCASITATRSFTPVFASGHDGEEMVILNDSTHSLTLTTTVTFKKADNTVVSSIAAGLLSVWIAVTDVNGSRWVLRSLT